MDIVSPQSGVDIHWYENIVKTILNFNTEGAWSVCDDDPDHYEWPHYSIDQFKEEWPPSKFGGADY